MNTAASLVLAVLAVAAPPASTANRSNQVTLENCLISAFDQVQVPGREAGVLVRLDPQTSKEGTEIKEGDLLGELDSEDLLVKEESARLEIDVAKAQAESEAELQATVKSKDVAEAELKSAQDANRRSPGSISDNDIRRLRFTVEKIGYEIELRRLERANYGRTAKIKEAQLKAVQVEIARRKLISPLDGVVVERMKHEGEWVQPGETVLKVVRLDKLRVEGFVPAEKYSPQSIAGAKVLVSVEMPGGGVETAEGVIEFVSPVVEASGEYRVWTEIENRRVKEHWLFRPGTVARMDVVLKPSGDRGGFRPISAVKTREN
jgi:macrolide-specific efflux system membrane fusion protein